MGLSEGEDVIRNIAAFLGVLQGLVWTILSLASVILYYERNRTIEIKTYMDTVNYNIYNYLFVNGRAGGLYPGQIFIPRVFTSFAWVHGILNLLWIAASICIGRQNGMKLVKAMRNWSNLVMIICLWDSITVIMLGVDYDRCLDSIDVRNYNLLYVIGDEERCANSILPVLVIAAKGFVLWSINFVFATLLTKVRKRLEKGSFDEAPPLDITAPPPYSPRETSVA